MKNINLILIICVLFFSCKKDKNISFPQELYFNKLNVKSQFKLYTKGSEITNQAIINKFKTDPYFFTIEKQKFANEKITFLSQDTALFGDSYRYSVLKNKNLFLFYAPTFSFGSSDFIPDILKYTSKNIPVSPLNQYDHLPKMVQVAHGSFRELDFSALSYLLVTRYSRKSGIIYNEVNDNITAELGALDTLAVVEYTINFRAR